MVFKHIMNLLDKNDIRVDLLHGFRRKWSYVSQLAITAEDIHRNLDNNQQAYMLMFDLGKAVDTVPHRRLLLKILAPNVQRKNTSIVDTTGTTSRTEKGKFKLCLSNIRRMTENIFKTIAVSPTHKQKRLDIKDSPICRWWRSLHISTKDDCKHQQKDLYKF